MRPAGAGPSLVLLADRMAREHRLAPRERDAVVFAARGIPRALFAAEAGVSERAMKATVARALDKLAAHSLDDVVRTLLREADTRRTR